VIGWGKLRFRNPTLWTMKGYLLFAKVAESFEREE
jgi:hypothetical protein